MLGIYAMESIISEAQCSTTAKEKLIHDIEWTFPFIVIQWIDSYHKFKFAFAFEKSCKVNEMI